MFEECIRSSETALGKINDDIRKHSNGLFGQIQTVPARRPNLKQPEDWKMIDGDRQRTKDLALYYAKAWAIQLYRCFWMEDPTRYNQEYPSSCRIHAPSLQQMDQAGSQQGPTPAQFDHPPLQQQGNNQGTSFIGFSDMDWANERFNQINTDVQSADRTLLSLLVPQNSNIRPKTSTAFCHNIA